MASERDPSYPGYRKFIAMPGSLSGTKRDFTASEYVSAFHNLQLAPHYMQMLRTHYYAPNQTLTATMMAKAVGYENFNAANLHYGGFRLTLAMGSYNEVCPYFNTYTQIIA